MSDTHRLRHLAESGDRDAAAELLRLARHGADTGDALLAATVLDDVDVLVELLDDALTRADHPAAARAARALGVEVDGEVDAFAVSLDALLEAANGRARNRRLSRAQLLATVGECVRAPARFAWQHAGDNASGTTSYALAVVVERDDRPATLVVAGARGAAKNPSPGKGFAGLKPWRRDLTANLERVRQWAGKPGGDAARIRLGLAERPEAAATADDGLDPALEPFAVELHATPSRAAFETLLRKLGDADAALVARADAWLDAHWPDRERGIARRTLKQVSRRPEAACWRLVRHVELPRSKSVPSDADVAALLDPDGPLTHVERLTWGVDAPDLLARVLTGGGLAQLCWLDLDRPKFTDPAWDAVFATEAWSRLCSLTMEPDGHDHNVRDRRVCAAITGAPGLRVLRLRAYMPFRDHHTSLARAVAEVGVEHLIFCGSCNPAFGLVGTIARGQAGDQLRTLALPDLYLRDEHVALLVDSEHLARLEALDLSRNRPLTGKSVVAVVGADKLAALRHLAVNHTVRDADELAALVDMPGLARFETLQLRTTRRPDDLVELLRPSRHLQADPDSLASEQGLELPD